MGKILWITLWLLLLSGARAANASLLIEPYGGYSVGTVSYKYLDTVTTPALRGFSDNGSANGFAYGTRAGLSLHHYALLVGEYQIIDEKQKFDTSTSDVAAKQTTIFVGAGFQMPYGFRAIASYGLNAQGEVSTLPDKTIFKGTAYKLLVGWIVPAGFAVNLEYTLYSYTSYTVAGTSNKISDNYSKYETSSALVTLSLPFTFMHGGNGSGASNARSQ